MNLSRPARLVLLSALPGLVGLYLLVCLPFALRHQALESEALAGFAEFQERATSVQLALQAVPGSLGKPLVEGCGEVLARVPIEQQMALVGPLPAGAPIKLEQEDHGFPRYTRVEPGVAGRAEGRLEDARLETGRRREASLGSSYGALLGSPFEWIDRSGRTEGLPRMQNVTTLLVGKVERVEAESSSGRALLLVRVFDYPRMNLRCEGDLEVTFFSRSAGAAGLDFLQARGLPRAMHLLSCQGAAHGPCRSVNDHAALTPPRPPEPAPATEGPATPEPAQAAQAAPVQPPAPKATSKPGAKRTTKKSGKRR